MGVGEALTVSAARRPTTKKALLLGGAALPTRSLQHLLMLLFAHALAALFDQRTHKRYKLVASDDPVRTLRTTSKG